MKWLLFTASVVNTILIVHSTNIAICHGANEVWDPCPSCDPNTCESIGKKYHCPLADSKSCKGACRCKPGFYRNKIGECISQENCLKCCGPHEYYSCGGACDNVCSLLSVQNKTKCPILNIKCNEMCYCEDGYARDDKNICVPIASCPPLSCGGDPNAQPGCGVNCGRLCSNYDKGPVFCPAICKVNGCDCKKGYVLDTNTGKCVLPSQCTPVCGQNETYTSCVEGGCYGARNCSEISSGQTVPVKCVKPIKCTGGCICKDGYLKNEYGVCIRAEDCSVDACNGDPNAKRGCGCSPTCADYFAKRPPRCSKICKTDACDCKPGYVLEPKSGKCILPKDCPINC